MKKTAFFLFVTLISLSVLAVFPCSGQQVNTLKKFEGGQIQIEFSFFSSIFSGIGSGASSVGKSCSSLNSDVSSLWWNPAGLATIRNRQLLLDVTPGFSLDVSKYYDIQGVVEESVDDAIADYRIPQTTIAYPKLSPRGGQMGGVGAGAVAVPFGDYVVGASINQPLYLKLTVLGNGLSTILETTKDMGESKKLIKLRIDASISLLFHARVSATGLAVARKFSPSWSAGLVLTRFHSKTSLDGKLQIDGVIETAGTEYAFNDPYDRHIDFEAGEQNDLNQSAYAAFAGSGWGIKIGSSYRIHPNLSLDGVLDLPLKLLLKGDMEVIQNTIPALNVNALSGGSDEEILDPTKLNLAKLTLTEPIENPTDDKLWINLPASLTLGAAYQLGFLKGTVNYSHFFREFSFKFLDATRGLKFKYSARLGLDFNWLRIGAGIIAADEIRSGTKEDGNARSNLLIPQASLGFGFSLLNRYQIDTLVLTLPSPILRISTLYRF